MGETFSQLSSQEDESKLILSQDRANGSKATSYSSTSSSKSFSSCVPCEEGATGGGFVTCPTCQGSGEIPQELEKQLVALIPYGDQRLKPRHTKLFVFLAVLICLVTSALIIFFLFPRSIAVQPAGLNSSTVAFDEADVHLNITQNLYLAESQSPSCAFAHPPPVYQRACRGAWHTESWSGQGGFCPLELEDEAGSWAWEFPPAQHST